MSNRPIQTRKFKAMFWQIIILGLSIICAIVAGLGWALLIATMAGYYYQSQNPTPAGEDNLGLGLMVVLWGSGAFLFSIPLVIFLVGVFKKAIAKILRKDVYVSK
jgi:hypothetical protein